jgi:hypothetical protein
MQGMMISLQERLSTSMAEMQGAQQSVATLEQKVHQLEMQRSLAAQAEQRLTSELSQVGSPPPPTHRHPPTHPTHSTTNTLTPTTLEWIL